MAVSRKSRSTELLPAAVARCLTRYTGDRDRLVVGLSGGVDSVALLHAARPGRNPIEALHIHHGLSPEADRWASFCQDLCRTWSVPLQIVRVDVERGSADGLEAAARRVRHEAFDSVAADWILLGHHRGDRAETLLFNLLRGAGVRGAGAMPERRGRLLRPLLDVRGQTSGSGSRHFRSRSNAWHACRSRAPAMCCVICSLGMESAFPAKNACPKPCASVSMRGRTGIRNSFSVVT